MRRKKEILHLASKSARRKDILESMGLKFKVVDSAYHEKPIPGLGPLQLVLTHAEGKARGTEVKHGWVLGADTIVYCRGQILGKPADIKEALAMLRLLSGKDHLVYTGVVLYHPGSGQIYKGADKTRVVVKKMNVKEMKNYFLKVTPFDKAGAYAIQMKPRIVTEIKGSHSNVVGLPKELLRKMLGEIQAAF